MAYRPLLLICTAATLLLACQEKKAPDSITISNDTIPVKLLAVQEETLQQQIEASGQFTTEDETFLSFKIGGVIRQVLVKEGDIIREGQLLAILNPVEIQAQVEQAATALEKAQRDFTRAENLYRDSVATLEQFQNSQTALAIAKQQFQIAGFNRQYAEIRAGSKGILLKKMAQEGQIVGPGTPIFQVNGAGKSPWILKVFVSEADWSRIRKGDKAFIITGEDKPQPIQASVQSIAEGVDPVSGTLWVNIRAGNNIPERLAAGLFGKAIILPSREEKGWRIPYDALLEGNGSKGFVFTTRDMKKAEKVAVEIGRIENGFVTITRGLENDTHIIIAGNAYLNNHAPIRITP